MTVMTRWARAGLALVALAAAGGCLDKGGTVMLTVEQAMGVSPTVTNFNATDATASTDSETIIHFTASSKEGTLTMLVLGPLVVGEQISLSETHNNASFDVTGAGWGSNGGMLTVSGLAPYVLEFNSVPMLHGSGSAQGSFVFTGTGTFK